MPTSGNVLGGFYGQYSTYGTLLNLGITSHLPRYYKVEDYFGCRHTMWDDAESELKHQQGRSGLYRKEFIEYELVSDDPAKEVTLHTFPTELAWDFMKWFKLGALYNLEIPGPDFEFTIQEIKAHLDSPTIQPYIMEWIKNIQIEETRELSRLLVYKRMIGNVDKQGVLRVPEKASDYDE